ncbi:MAG TPA: hypothetical protein ENK21_03120 [Trueperaceae bacterium]|nr:hypothetical protein [Trueperaceae bacterium]
MNTLRINTITWLVLVLLTLFGYFMAEGSSLAKPVVFGLVLAATAIKFLSVGFQFLDLKEAHLAWRILFLGFILIFAVAMFFLA